ncbi:LCP family protein [Nesterenkonia xinjiangensis]|uniref:LCP family protein required for cell wall assembly n=1 Tax=Nesterenkonia xinjiangensis TaxID=225327 RepID=A0A7Z0K8V1_9MICC|nr:LCP family protein [Nesterenkonia xinjiangensis]NYJ77043.1 LCP family protein required for cell wall assembly [Nesterenkonia xinjiangensis]
MTPANVTYHRFTTEPEVVRSPQRGSSTDRTRRAVLLLAMTLFLPGSAQIAAGHRGFGRKAVAVTIAVWAVLLVGVVMFFTLRGLVLGLATRPFTLWMLTVLLGALAVGWAVLWIDTFRLLRITTLAPGLKPIMAVATVLLMAITSGGLGYAAHLVNESRGSLSGIFSAGPAIDAVDGRYNFLLLGADAGEGREGLRPDSIHVVSVNENSGESILISIPRNFQNARFNEGSPLWDAYPTGYDCGNECIINFLYTDVMNHHQDLYPDADDPGAEAMMDATSGILDLDVNGYVMIDMDGFAHLIDAMGGVTVDSGGWVPYRGPRPDGTWGDNWWGPGEHTFSGEDALAYARSRTFSSDYNRIQRQQCIQQAMIAQFNPQTLLTRFTEIMDAGEQVVETNLPQSQLGSFLDLAVDAKEQKPQRLVLGAPDFGSAGDQFSTYPDFDEIHQRVDELIEQEEGGGSWFSSAGPQKPVLGAAVVTTASVETRDAVEDDEPSLEDETEIPTQPDGSPLTVEYLRDLQDAGQQGVLEEAASSNYECTPLR